MSHSVKNKGTIWQNASEKRPLFAAIFSRPFKDQLGTWCNRMSFRLNDLKPLINVAFEEKQWITAHTRKRCTISLGSLRRSGSIP
ncbi:MAG: hypothetical protein CV089_03225 [Nitrospira sp. WS110]|nr:hypothetical protein [Nitrospira sp. WS110]